MAEDNHKLLVIGFDALDYGVSRRRPIDGFEIHPLYSPVPATGPGWTSMYTGDSLGAHGVGDVWGLETSRRYARSDWLHNLRFAAHQLARRIRRKPVKPRYASPATTKSTYLWATLGGGGVTTKLVNMPITCPVSPIEGIVLGGFPVLTRTRWYYPGSIGGKIPPEYVRWTDMVHWFQDPERQSHRVWKRGLADLGADAALRRAEDDSRKLIDLFCELPAQQVEMIQFSFIDRIGHITGIDGDIEQRCYDMAAELAAELLERVRPASAMLVSDHGFAGDDHTDLGVWGLAGEIAEKVRIPEGYRPSLLDVAPTVAGFFGLEHPCEGNDLTGGGEITGRTDEQDAAEREDMIRRMRDLGYL